MNLAEMRARIADWLDEDVSDSKVNDAINDAIESLWQSIILVQLSQFMGGPTTASFAASSERAQVISVADPTVAPTLGQVAGGALAGGNVFVAFTLVTESGSETLISPTAQLVLLANNLLQVTSPAYDSGALGYNVYVGASAARLGLQNAAPIPFGTAWTEPEDGYVEVPDAPGPPTENTTSDNIFYIRHMEVRTPDSSYKAWNQADIDSLMFRRAAAAIATDSPYQNYYFDFINGRTIELRPAAGGAVVPRYFFINRPRRLRFDNAQIPFNNMPHELFVRCFAISLIKLSLEEFASSTAWSQQADKAKADVIRAVDQMNKGKDMTITPYLS